jgi:hypothetical protein
MILQMSPQSAAEGFLKLIIKIKTFQKVTFSKLIIAEYELKRQTRLVGTWQTNPRSQV